MPYTRTPCVTEISGSGTINGNISVFHNHVIKFHGDLTYDTTGSSRSVTKGTAWYTDTDEYHSSYGGNGTWTRPAADGRPLTGGTANVTLSSIDQFDSDASLSGGSGGRTGSYTASAIEHTCLS